MTPINDRFDFIIKSNVVVLSYMVVMWLQCSKILGRCIYASYFSFQACQLPLFEYLVEKMCSLCYDRAWYAKFGG